MGYCLRHLSLIAALVVLIACADVPGSSIAPATPASGRASTALQPPRATAQPPLATAMHAAPFPTATLMSVAEATSAPPPAPTALPADRPTVSDEHAPLASPTATPTFPKARITEHTLPALRLLRTVGLGFISQVAIAPDNHMLAVATSAGVALFELPSLRQLRFDPIDGGARTITFSDDGQTLVITTGTYDHPKQIERRRVADGMLLETTPAVVPSELPALTSLSPSGQVQAALEPLDSVPNPGVTLTRVADGATIYTDTMTAQVTFSPDSTLAALVSYTGTVRLLDLRSGAVSELRLPPIWSIAFSPDGQTMATAGQVMTLWNVVDGTLRQRTGRLAVAGEISFNGVDQWAHYSPDGRVLTIEGQYNGFENALRYASAWTVSEHGLTHAWDVDANGPGLTNADSYVSAISPATDAAAWTDDGRALGIYHGGKRQRILQIPDTISALAFSPDGTRLAVGDSQGQIRLVRADNGAPVQTIQAEGAAWWLAFSPDGALLAAKSADGMIRVWRVGEQRRLAQITDTPAHDATWPVHVPFLMTTDHEWLISWDQDGVRIYRLSDGRLVHRIAVDADEVAIGPHRRLLAILHKGQVQLWGVPENVSGP